MPAEPWVLKCLGGRHALRRVAHEQALQEVEALGAASQPWTIVQGNVVHDDRFHDLLQGARAALRDAGPAQQRLFAQKAAMDMPIHAPAPDRWPRGAKLPGHESSPMCCGLCNQVRQFLAFLEDSPEGEAAGNELVQHHTQTPQAAGHPEL